MPDDETTQDGPPTDGDEAVDAAVATVIPPSEAVRNSPEFKVLERQNRELARQAGRAAREANEARAAAETARQAAEAQQQADLEQELMATLGEDGIAEYNEIVELTQSDPRAAARRMAQLVASSRAQSSGAPAEPPTTPATEPEGGATVPPTTPPPPRGVGADASLSQPPRTEGDDYEAIAADLDRTYQGVVERVQNPETRARTTMKDRAQGFIAYVGSSVLRAGARPSK